MVLKKKGRGLKTRKKKKTQEKMNPQQQNFFTRMQNCADLACEKAKSEARMAKKKSDLQQTFFEELYFQVLFKEVKAKLKTKQVKN